MNPYQVVDDFEKAVAEYAGAKYAVAVESCTSALLLAMKYYRVDEVTLPNKTYVGVAHSVLHAGGKCVFSDYEWKGAYQLNPYPIIDSARRFHRDMYVPGTLYCLSFHWAKHIPIGRGGMILTDNKEAYEWLKRARLDGRKAGVPPKEDTFDVPGYHVYMIPELAARGLMFMSLNKNKDFEDLPEDNYADLSKLNIFKDYEYRHHVSIKKG